MREVNIGQNQPTDYIQVNVKDKHIKIPLFKDIPLVEIENITKAKKADDRFNVLVNILRTYIPEDIYNTLTARDVAQIINVWSETSKEETGATLGES